MQRVDLPRLLVEMCLQTVFSVCLPLRAVNRERVHCRLLACCHRSFPLICHRPPSIPGSPLVCLAPSPAPFLILGPAFLSCRKVNQSTMRQGSLHACPSAQRRSLRRSGVSPAPSAGLSGLWPPLTPASPRGSPGGLTRAVLPLPCLSSSSSFFYFIIFLYLYC